MPLGKGFRVIYPLFRPEAHTLEKADDVKTSPRLEVQGQIQQLINPAPVKEEERWHKRY